MFFELILPCRFNPLEYCDIQNLRKTNIRLTGNSVPEGLGAVVAKQEP